MSDFKLIYNLSHLLNKPNIQSSTLIGRIFFVYLEEFNRVAYRSELCSGVFSSIHIIYA